VCRLKGLDDLRRGELEENTERKEFTVSEMVAIKRSVEPREREKAILRESAGKKPSENFAAGRVRDIVGKYFHKSGVTVSKAEKIVEAAEKEPERFLKLLQDVDAGIVSIEKAYRTVVQELGPVNETVQVTEGVGAARDEVKAIKALERNGNAKSSDNDKSSLAAKAFQLFESGKGPVDAVISSGMLPDIANDYFKKWVEMKKATSVSRVCQLG